MNPATYLTVCTQKLDKSINSIGWHPNNVHLVIATEIRNVHILAFDSSNQTVENIQTLNVRDAAEARFNPNGDEIAIVGSRDIVSGKYTNDVQIWGNKPEDLLSNI